MAVHKIDGGPGGENDHFPKKFVTLYASAACTAGFFVSIDDGDTTNGLGASVRNAEVGATSVTGQGLTFGVATQTVAAGADVVVQIAGKYENASVDGATAIGSALIGPLSGGTIGMASIQTASTLGGPVIAVALEADTATLADVMVINQGFF